MSGIATVTKGGRVLRMVNYESNTNLIMKLSKFGFILNCLGLQQNK